jgi:hypothetical protein
MLEGHYALGSEGGTQGPSAQRNALTESPSPL